MAESRTATFNRYLRGDFTPAEAKGIIAFLVFDKVMDIATYGSINRLTGKALTATTKQVLTKVLPFAARGAATVGGSVGMSAARAALPLVTNPYVAGTALGYGALQTQPGQDLLEAAGDSGRMTRIRFEQALTDVNQSIIKTKARTKSKFNKAVSRGLAAVKAGTSYGKKGIISAPKKAFAVVTKMASKINRAKKEGRRFPKAPKTPNAKKIYKSILKVLK
jgi:hypothetical protein